MADVGKHFTTQKVIHEVLSPEVLNLKQQDKVYLDMGKAGLVTFDLNQINLNATVHFMVEELTGNNGDFLTIIFDNSIGTNTIHVNLGVYGARDISVGEIQILEFCKFNGEIFVNDMNNNTFMKLSSI